MNERSNLSADLFSLALAPLSERVAALAQAWERQEETGRLPSQAVQIAGLIVAETVRLIRVGSPSELSEGALELAQFMARPETEIAAQAHSESHRLVSGSSVVLGVASAPSSGGAELGVLRSWNGKAREALELLNRAHGKALARSELRSALGELTESHLSHLLADLEASGLAVRIREGKTVTVHLGPTGRSDLVQEQLGPRQLPKLKYKGPTQDFDTHAMYSYKGIYTPVVSRLGGSGADIRRSIQSSRRMERLAEPLREFAKGDRQADYWSWIYDVRSNEKHFEEAGVEGMVENVLAGAAGD